MIEYDVSLTVRRADASTSRLQQVLGAGIKLNPSKRDPNLISLERTSTYRDCHIDFAVNHFLDGVHEALTASSMTAVSLKVASFFDAEKVAALNFELLPATLNRLSLLGCTFDLWAMPAD